MFSRTFYLRIFDDKNIRCTDINKDGERRKDASERLTAASFPHFPHSLLPVTYFGFVISQTPTNNIHDE